jgi:AcrR family transcriptional regulator
MVDVPGIGAVRARRGEILAAAEREFGSLGWSGARVERIAADAKVNKQLIFHYFGSKAGLCAAATRSLLARYEPKPAPTANPVETLRAVLRALETAARAIPGVLLHPVPVDTDAVPDGAPDLASSWRDRQHARLAEAVTEGQRRGHFRDDLDPAAAASIGLALAVGSGAIGRPVDAAAWMVDYCAWR